MSIYHYTDTLHLPWIIETRELWPGLNRVSGLPFDFLWGTINPAGDRTCSAQGSTAARDAYRRGLSQLVRFTLPDEAFSNWSDVTKLYPEWTPEQVARTEKRAIDRGETEYNNWRIRRDPLPLAQVLTVEAKSYTSNRWAPIGDAMKEYVSLSDVEGGRGVIIGERIYLSRKVDAPNGAVGYTTMGVVPADRMTDRVKNYPAALEATKRDYFNVTREMKASNVDVLDFDADMSKYRDHEGITFVTIGFRHRLTMAEAKTAAEFWRKATTTNPKAFYWPSIMGYDDDPRELWEFEDVREFVRQWARLAGITGVRYVNLEHEDPLAHSWLKCAAGEIKVAYNFVGLLVACDCDGFEHIAAVGPDGEPIKPTVAQ